MKFDPDNQVVKLCARGMELEGKGQLEEAEDIFKQAWNIATNDAEKFTAAHYVARHQKTITDKLSWDNLALQHALNINEESIKTILPSLYLNIGKCYEDLHDPDNAKSHYQQALSVAHFLPDDGYGNMIKAGINNGLDRIS